MAEADDRFLQYAARDGAFVRCGRTRARLDPGLYDVEDTGYGNWGLRPKKAVCDDLIDIPGTIADDIFLDIDRFLQTKSAYELYGLTHKRGYLLYGPPGSGKTSLGLMLARRFIEAGGIVMWAGGFQEFYEGVAIMRDVEPGRHSMYLIEEAETIVNNPHCLSILDGELSIHGAVFVAMTNYKSRMPPRITNRPGRFDRVELVSCPPEPVQLEYLRRVEARGGKNPGAPERIVSALRGLPVSMAHLREAFISHVLMGVPLRDLRTRFEIMCKSSQEDEASEFLAEAKATYANEVTASTDFLSYDEDADPRFWKPDRPMK